MGARIVRGTGWLMLSAAVLILLYVVYLLWFTGRSTDQAQRDFAEQWSQVLAAPADGVGPPATPPTPTPSPDPTPTPTPVLADDLYAMLWFERDGQRIVTDRELFVVEGVTLDQLALGPGHYPESVGPGEDGNFAIAGHRTTYGAPFWSIDELQEGDTIHVMDRQGVEWVYTFAASRVVQPTERWVVDEPDPLGTGRPTITLTTCHPRFSAAQRLIVWGELVEVPAGVTQDRQVLAGA